MGYNQAGRHPASGGKATLSRKPNSLNVVRYAKSSYCYGRCSTFPDGKWQGRFNLNDLHLAAGGKAKHRPNQFLRLDSTFELILEIDRCADMRIDKNQAVSVQKGGSGPQGTYACRELVIAYAAWINPAFHHRYGGRASAHVCQRVACQPHPHQRGPPAARQDHYSGVRG